MTTNRYKLVGALLAFVPFNWILSYAVVAIAIGEDRLEGDNAVVLLAPAVMLAPHLLGALVLLRSDRLQARWPLNDRRLFRCTVAAGGCLLAVGLWSVIAQAVGGDANIGGSLLVLMGLVLVAAGCAGIFALHRVSGSPSA